MSKNIKMIFSYNGSEFNGWHGDDTNINCRYIKNLIQKGLLLIFPNEIEIYCAGRTDSGVHGIRQVCSFVIPYETDLNRLKRTIEYAANIGIYSITYTDITFHARFCAKQRQYMYLISQIKSPLLHNRVFFSKNVLNMENMNKVCEFLITQKDLAFFAPKSYTGSTMKSLDYLYIDLYNLYGIEVIRINVGSKSFFHHLIRNIVGCLYEVGRNKWSVEEFKQRFLTKDRKNCASMIDACGLYFLDCKY